MAIIGVSGYKTVGKDTVGSIIQYLTDALAQKDNVSFKDFNYRNKLKGYTTSEWEIKKFADKIKQILSILIGVPIEDFEREEIKNKHLGEEWRIYQKMVYFDGWKNCSKDEFDSVENPNDKNSYIPTIRECLQLIGTELFRDRFHIDTWLNALFADYNIVGLTDGWIPSYNDPDNINFAQEAEPIYPNWIITDVRYPNEADRVLEQGGIVIRINQNKTSEEWNRIVNSKDKIIKILDPDGWDRTNYDYSWSEEKISIREFYKRVSRSTIQISELYLEWVKSITHPSEISLDDYANFNYVIDNSGDFNNLISQVKDILIKEKII